MTLTGKNLSFSYDGKKNILKHFDISIESGEFVAVLGKSGRGKSTLGKLLTGYEVPTTGEVKIDGIPLPKKGFCPVQLIFQHPEQAVNPRFTIKKILEESGGCDLEKVGLSAEYLHRFPYELSGGQLQRVCIARALTPQTKFIVADEMTTMLDAITQMEIWQFFSDYCIKYGIGVLVITHNAHLVEKVCDRVVKME